MVDGCFLRGWLVVIQEDQDTLVRLVLFNRNECGSRGVSLSSFVVVVVVVVVWTGGVGWEKKKGLRWLACPEGRGEQCVCSVINS